MVLALPILFGLMNVPLALSLIAPNHLYGYRTARSFASTDSWYLLNAIAGWSGIVAATVVVAADALIVVSGTVGAERRATWGIGLFVGGTLLSLAIPSLFG